MHTESFEMLTFWLVSPRNRPRNRPRSVRFRFCFQNRPKPTDILVKNRKTDRAIFHFRFTTLYRVRPRVPGTMANVFVCVCRWPMFRNSSPADRLPNSAIYRAMCLLQEGPLLLVQALGIGSQEGRPWSTGAAHAFNAVLKERSATQSDLHSGSQRKGK